LSDCRLQHGRIWCGDAGGEMRQATRQEQHQQLTIHCGTARRVKRNQMITTTDIDRLATSTHWVQLLTRAAPSSHVCRSAVRAGGVTRLNSLQEILLTSENYLAGINFNPNHSFIYLFCKKQLTERNCTIKTRELVEILQHEVSNNRIIVVSNCATDTPLFVFVNLR